MALPQHRPPPLPDDSAADHRAKRARQQLSLIFQPQLPRYPFVNSPFDVTAYLFDDMNQVKCGDEIPLSVRLMLNGQPRTYVDDDILQVEPPSPQLHKDGKCTFRVMMRDVSVRYEHDFVLQVSAVTRNSKYYVAPVISDPMTVIRYRLAIRPESQPPPIWYKDEGGRDKCIEVFVDLMDSKGQRVVGQEFPVKVSLLYEDLLPVTKQDILKLSSESRQLVDETGTAALRLRIEDVSKNHQSKGFVIKVGPDTQHSPMNSDISPDISTPISVRSKRNRRNKQGSVGGGRNDDDNVSVVGNAMSLRGSMDLAMPVSQHPLHDAPHLPTPDPKLDAAANPVLKSLSSVISWTRTVVNGLYQIQWQLIGYESKADGSPDINRPLFNIHNPNTIVSGILQSYRNETMDHLRYLVQATDPEGGAGGNMAAVASAQQNGRSAFPGAAAAAAAGGGGGAYGYQPQDDGMAGASMDGGGGGPGMYHSAEGLGRSMSQSSAQGEEPPPLARAFGGYNTTGASSSGYDHRGTMDSSMQDGTGSLASQGAGRASSGSGSGGGGAAYGGDNNGNGPPSMMYPTTSLTSTSNNHNGAVQPPPPPSRPPFPPMLRGRSATISADHLNQDMSVAMIPLVRESTYDLLAAMDPSWFQMEADGVPGGGVGGGGMAAAAAASVMESQVYYIVAKSYMSSFYGELGFPAFDQKQTLLGFYKEGVNERAETVAFYVPLPPSFDDTEIQQVGALLVEEIRQDTGSVAQMGSIGGGDINQLKEKALTYHWSRGQGGGMASGTNGNSA